MKISFNQLNYLHFRKEEGSAAILPFRFILPFLRRFQLSPNSFSAFS
jgi:hypothetical protein